MAFDVNWSLATGPVKAVRPMVRFTFGGRASECWVVVQFEWSLREQEAGASLNVAVGTALIDPQCPDLPTRKCDFRHRYGSGRVIG